LGLLGWLIPWQLTPTDIACAPGEDCETGPVPGPGPGPGPGPEPVPGPEPGPGPLPNPDNCDNK
jgi:hypothetical protein